MEAFFDPGLQLFRVRFHNMDSTWFFKSHPSFSGFIEGGHNIRMILAHLRALWAEIVAAIYAMFGTKRAPIAAQTGLRSLTA